MTKLVNSSRPFNARIALAAACLAMIALKGWGVESDIRSLSMNCALDKAGQHVDCDYRHSASIDVKNASLKVGNLDVQIPTDGLKKYPVTPQTSAFLFLVDISDPQRKKTIESKNTAVLSAMLQSAQSHQKFGIAVFDKDLKVLTPISSNVTAAKGAVDAIKASGQSTEFYRSVIDAISLLEKTDASRKGLIIMSDGKAEDRAYGHSDAIKAAERANVVILGLGFSERPTDSPAQQTIRRLAEDTHGLYFDASEGAVPSALVGKPFAFVEKGGRITFAVSTIRGIQPVTVTLNSADGKKMELTAKIDFPDRRTREEIIKETALKFWPVILGAVLVLIGGITFTFLWMRRRAIARRSLIPYATLMEMDAAATKYPLIKPVVRIGRGAENDIRLTNDSISARHAEIHRRRDGQIYLIDLGSSNGVYVNNSKLERAELNDGDVIELGEVRLRFSLHKP